MTDICRLIAGSAPDLKADGEGSEVLPLEVLDLVFELRLHLQAW